MAKFYTDRYWFKYGNEWDEVECTTKVWDSFEKAQAYAYRYAKGVKFYYVQILDENCNLLWSYNYMSEEEDFRENKETQKEENAEKVTEDNSEEKIINSSFEDISEKNLIRIGSTKHIEDYG